MRAANSSPITIGVSMSTFWSGVTAAHVAVFAAGFIAVLVSVADTWFFHAAFGATTDVGLLTLGLGLMGGVTVPTVTTAVATANDKTSG